VSTPQYVISQDFEADDYHTALAKAAAWVTLQAGAIDDVHFVGDLYFVSVYYQQAKPKEQSAPADPPLRFSDPLTTGSLKIVVPKEASA
jgi:hypothetical protein